MSKHRLLRYGDPVPESYFNAWQEFISTAAMNFTLSVAPGNPPIAVQVVAGADNDQVGIGINGLWRYITQTVSATVGPTAGNYDVFVTSAANAFQVNLNPPPPEIDNTNYAFSLVARPRGQTPTQPQWRKVGEAVFDGSRITSLRQIVGQIDSSETFSAGDMKQSFAINPPAGWLRCDGALYLVADYPELFGAIGYAYGGSGANFNVPDMRDRFPMGAGTTALGTRDGAASVALALSQLPAHGHYNDFMSQAEDRDHQHLMNAIGTGGVTANHFHYQNINNANQAHVVIWTSGAQGSYYIVQGSGWTGTSTDQGDHGHVVPAAWSAARSTAHLHQIAGWTQNNGGGAAHENRPPFVTVNFFIKT
ncbi:MAG: tail fiber protein [Acidimicrobiaceae bacterium]|nr:tail fiber protein [Acidimicrobiaceae bacterium]